LGILKALFLAQNTGEGHFEKKILRNLPGSIQARAGDSTGMTADILA